MLDVCKMYGIFFLEEYYSKFRGNNDCCLENKK